MTPSDIYDPWEGKVAKMDDKQLELLLAPLLREWLVRLPSPYVHTMKDEHLLQRLKYTFQDTRSTLARGDNT